MTEKVRDKHDQIFITEKMDGSNVGVVKKDGRLIAVTRSGYEADTSTYKHHHVFNKWVHHPDQHERFNSLLKEGERIVGEWCHQPHGTKYHFKVDPFFVFDFFDSNNKRLDWYSVMHKCNSGGFEYTRMVSEFGARSIDLAWKLLLDKTEHRFTRLDPPEGLVYRCERKGEFDFMAKWVRPDYEPGKYLDK